MKTTNLWKLGLFVLLGLSASAATLWWIGLARSTRETVETVTYFDESVNGLDLGAPVKMRGVKIGSVSRISFAPDQRRVEVRSQIYRDMLAGLGLAFGEGPQADGRMIPHGMRVQLATTGLTGIRFLLVDLLDPARFPEPELAFEPPRNYLPAAPSTLKSLEDGIIALLDSVPPIAQELEQALTQLNTKFEALDVAGLSQRARSLLERLEHELEELSVAALAEEARATLSELRGGAAEARALLARAGAEEGLVDSLEALAQRLERTLDEAELARTSAAVRAAATSVGELAREGGVAAQGLYTSLATLHETLRAMRALAESIERDPAGLLRGASRP